MKPHASTTAPERAQTDKSLKDERHKTDREIEKRHQATDVRSDAVIETARGRADEVLGGAREQADRALELKGGSQQDRRTLAEERAKADQAVEHERRTADEKLEGERTERERVLTALLRFEREQTDERLLIERARGDAAMAAKDDFMTMVSHDVRTLLGSIAMAAGLQIKNASNDDAGRKSAQTAQKIQRFTARINRLVGDLVDVAGIEAGRFTVVPETQDAVALLTDSVDAFQPAATEKQITIEVSLPDEPVLARFDRDRVLQVVANLLSNSLKFTAAGGTITVSLQKQPDEVRIVVSDTGTGIPDDQLESVFQRFWQVMPDDRRGLGLGLFISQRIVEAHGGKIWAQSKLGQSTTFTFTLPTSQTTAAKG